MSRRKKRQFGKHTSLPDGLKKSIDELIKQEFVKRTILGRFYPTRNNYQPGFLKYQMDTQTGIKINGYVPSGVQEIFVCIKPLSKRKEIIEYINQKM